MMNHFHRSLRQPTLRTGRVAGLTSPLIAGHMTGLMTSLAIALCLPMQTQAQTSTPAQLLTQYSQQGGARPDAGRGQQFFTSKHGREWACASCHGATPSGPGQHAATGRAIRPLAPAFNPDRFADAAKTEKWFRRNCNDVVGRECTPAEKADVLAWLLTLKP